MDRQTTVTYLIIQNLITVNNKKMKNTILNVIVNDKIILTNGAVLSISFTNIEMILKIVLLIASITWTGIKIYKEVKNKYKDEGKNR